MHACVHERMYVMHVYVVCVHVCSYVAHVWMHVRMYARIDVA